MRIAEQWGNEIPAGVIYRNNRVEFEKHFSVLAKGRLVQQGLDRSKLKKVMEAYE